MYACVLNIKSNIIQFAWRSGHKTYSSTMCIAGSQFGKQLSWT